MQKLISVLSTGILLSSAMAFADHPDLDDYEDVRRAAHSVDSNAQRFLRTVERNSGLHDRRERAALDQARDLARAADDFRREVERRRLGLDTTERDFERLALEVDKTRAAKIYLRGASAAAREWNEIERTVRELRMFYGRDDDARAEDVARRLVTTTERALRQAEIEARGQHRAIFDIRRLVDASRRVLLELERGTSGFRLRDDVRELRRLQANAADAVRGARFSERVERPIVRADRLIDRLDRELSDDRPGRPGRRPGFPR